MLRKLRFSCFLAALGLFIISSPSRAEPWMPPGDLGLRQDIQLLADSGIITSPVTTWPIAWATVAADVAARKVDDSRPEAVNLALQRVQARLALLNRVSGIQPTAEVGVATGSFWTRTYEDTPRDKVETTLGATWMNDRLAVRLQGQYINDANDGQDWRMDGSYAAVIIGNQILSAGAMDRWWGPAWDNTLMLSSNARPVGGFGLDRNVSKPFETKWLRWVGPWTYSLFWGFLGDDRVVPNSRLLAFRGAFRPIPALEIGVSRAAIWCGSGRPCDSSALWDIVRGKDNAGEGDITQGNQPSNQMAAIDARWRSPIGDAPYALYTQWMADDEVNNLPSNWAPQFGVEIWGESPFDFLPGHYTAHVEATTSFGEVWESAPSYNTLYEHNIYQTGYRYKGRALGAGTDNDSVLFSVGSTLTQVTGETWSVLVRYGNLNRKGDGEGKDRRQTVTTTEQDRYNLQVSHTRPVHYRGINLGSLRMGLGLQYIPSDDFGNGSETDVQGFLQWKWDAQGL